MKYEISCIYNSRAYKILQLYQQFVWIFHFSLYNFLSAITTPFRYSILFIKGQISCIHIHGWQTFLQYDVCEKIRKLRFAKLPIFPLLKTYLLMPTFKLGMHEVRNFF